MSNEKNKMRDLFHNEESFNEIKENEIVFPMCFKSRNELTFTKYLNKEKFEEITLSRASESFRGSLLIGFNESLHDLKYDLKIWYHCVSRVHEKITEQEYETIFEKFINGRAEFFQENSESIYIEKLPLSNNPTKHKWKAPQF